MKFLVLKNAVKNGDFRVSQKEKEYRFIDWKGFCWELPYMLSVKTFVWHIFCDWGNKAGNNRLFGKGSIMYLKMDEAEELKRTYSSWIGKKAHIGNGLTDTLRNITIKPKKNHKGFESKEQLYRIEFEFECNKKFSAIEFLFYNSLILGQAYSSYNSNKRPGQIA